MKGRNNKGITLISLVITIIILLILAGVSINTLFGGNGLITQAIKAAEESKKAEYREKVNLIIQEEQMNKIAEQTKGLFIEGIAGKIRKQEWQKTVTICNEEFGQPQNDGEKTILIIDTKDGYEITVRVDNIKIQAEIISIIKGKAKTLTLTYKPNEGTGEEIEESVREGFSIKVIKNPYEREGYEFVGWSTDKNGEVEYVEGNTIENITKDIDLYAIWSKTTVTITFNGDGKTYEQVIQKGEETPLVEYSTTGISKTGYKFKGWSETEEGEVKYEDGVNVNLTEDINLYAIYEQDSVAASLSITNGSSATNELTKGTTINIKATSTKTDIANIKLEMIKNGTTVAKIYENLTGGKEQNITLDGLEEDLINLDKITIFNTYECKLTATTETGAISEQTINLTDYTVASANDLNVLATNVNKGTTYSGKTITLVGNITTSENYIPIGYYDGQGSWTGPYFAGTFEGNNYIITLSSMTTSTTYKSSGIFGMIIGGNVYDLTVKGENKSAISYTGGIVGGIENGKIENCKNYCNIYDETKLFKGGIVGISINSNISKCENISMVCGYSAVGGICGSAINNSEIIQCINSDNSSIYAYGKETLSGKIDGTTITKDFGVVGGIIGITELSEIRDCINKGEITYAGNANAFVGGIVGWGTNNSTIQLSKNLGLVSSNNSGGVGGIVGGIITSTISQSYNNRTITSTSDCGGIIGYGVSITVENCYNSAKVEGQYNIGGIAGKLQYDGTTKNVFNNCYNSSTEILGDNTVGSNIGLSENTSCSYNSCVGSTPVGSTVNTTFVGTTNIVYTQLEMSTTDSLLNLLNQGDGAGLWARDTTRTINGGYPYLVNNQP